MRCISLLVKSLPWSMESIIRCWTESVLFFFSDGFLIDPGTTGSSGSETRRCGLLGFSTSPQKILVIFVSWSWSSRTRCFFRCWVEGDYSLSELSPCWSKRLTCFSNSLISVTIGPTCLKIFTWFSSILTRSVTYWPLRLINWKARIKRSIESSKPTSLPAVVYPQRWNASIRSARVSVDCQMTCCTRMPTVSSYPDWDWIGGRARLWTDCYSRHPHRRRCVDRSSINSIVPIRMTNWSWFEASPGDRPTVGSLNRRALCISWMVDEEKP